MTDAGRCGRGSVVRAAVRGVAAVSWINTAYPFAAAYLMTTRQIDRDARGRHAVLPRAVQPRDVRDQRRLRLRVRPAQPAQGRRARRRARPADAPRSRCGPRALSCVPFVVYLVVVGSPLSWLVLAVSLFFVVFYSAPPLRLKELPFADSVTSSIHFFSPAVYGLVLAGAAWTWQLAAVILAFALWGVASHAFGAVQDVAADREAGISSIATARGARWTVLLLTRLLRRRRPGDACHPLARPARGAGRAALPRDRVAVPHGHRRDGGPRHARLAAVPVAQPDRRLRVTLLLIWWWFLTA